MNKKTEIIKKPFCPECSKVKFGYASDGISFGPMSDSPVLLVKRTNSKNKDWFYGCPNFPKCHFTKRRPATAEERKIKIRAWANSLCGPHF